MGARLAIRTGDVASILVPDGALGWLDRFAPAIEVVLGSLGETSTGQSEGVAVAAATGCIAVRVRLAPNSLTGFIDEGEAVGVAVASLSAGRADGCPVSRGPDGIELQGESGGEKGTAQEKSLGNR